MIRKLAIAAIPVFIKVQPLGSLQAVLGEIVLVIYIFVVSYLKPFGNPHDNLLQVGSMIGEAFSLHHAIMPCSLQIGRCKLLVTGELSSKRDHASTEFQIAESLDKLVK